MEGSLDKLRAAAVQLQAAAKAPCMSANRWYRLASIHGVHDQVQMEEVMHAVAVKLPERGNAA